MDGCGAIYEERENVVHYYQQARCMLAKRLCTVCDNKLSQQKNGREKKREGREGGGNYREKRKDRGWEQHA